MPKPKYDLVVFDCDGTLTDTGITHVKWCNDINLAQKFNLPIVKTSDPTAVRAVLGNPMETVLRKYGFPQEKIPELVSLYQETFSIDPSYASYTFTGVPEMLKKLQGITIRGLVSSNVWANIVRDLNTSIYDFNNRAIISKERLDEKKWKKSDALKWLQKYFRSKYPIYIGDTSKDQQAAKEANWPFIWATYGWEMPSENYPNQAKNIVELEKLLEI